MKVTIAYLPEEQQKAKNLLRLLQSFLADSIDRVKESNQRSPYSHIYLTTRKPRRPMQR